MIMITPAVLYKETEKWVSPNKDVFQHIYFDGEHVFASDTHSLLVFKNYPAEKPHFETTAGSEVISEREFPAESCLRLVNPRKVIWRYELKIDTFNRRTIIDDWLSVFKVIKQNYKYKEGKTTYPGVTLLAKQGTRLCVYAATASTGVKFILLDDLPAEGEDWLIPFGADRIIRHLELLRTLWVDKAEIIINRENAATILFDTEDTVSVTCQMNSKFTTSSVLKKFPEFDDDFLG